MIFRKGKVTTRLARSGLELEDRSRHYAIICHMISLGWTLEADCART